MRQEPSDPKNSVEKAPDVVKTKDGDPLYDQLEVEVRHDTALEWVKAVRDVATRTNDKEALELVAFMEDRTALGIPMPGGANQCIFFGGKPEHELDYYAYLAPVIVADRGRLPVDDDRLNLMSGLPAQYSEGSHALYLGPWDLEPIVKGVVLLHELKHAYIDLVEKPERHTNDQHWREEAEVFKFEFRLLEILGGDDYKGLIRSAANCIHKQESAGGELRLSWDFTSTKEELEKVLTKLGIQQADARSIMTTVRELNALWLYAQENAGDPDLQFIDFVKWTYIER